MLAFVSASRDTSVECGDVRDVDPGDGAGIVVSKSLARRRERSSQAKVRSTTDSPTACDKFEAFGDVRMFDDP